MEGVGSSRFSIELCKVSQHQLPTLLAGDDYLVLIKRTNVWLDFKTHQQLGNTNTGVFNLYILLTIAKRVGNV